MRIWLVLVLAVALAGCDDGEEHQQPFVVEREPAASCGKRLVNDFWRDGAVDAAYARRCYAWAISHVPVTNEFADPSGKFRGAALAAARERRRLEHALVHERGFVLCGADCRTFERTGARCLDEPRMIGGRAWYLCALRSRERRTERPGPAENVCATLGLEQEYVARERGDCLR